MDWDSFVPLKFKLEQNYPNPFNPGTIISWQLATGGNVSIKIFNSLGEEVDTIVDKFFEAGNHSYRFEADSSLPSGIYFYRLTSGTFVETKKMVLIH